MSRRHQNLFDEIFFLGAHAGHADAAAFLPLVSVQVDSFDVAAVRERDNNIVVVNQVFRLERRKLFADNFRAPFVVEFFFDGGKFVFDNLQNFLFVAEDFVKLFNRGEDALIFFVEFVALKSREFLQTQIQNRLSLRVAELK